VATEGGTVVWDAKVADHHHAVCRSCGLIVDVDASLDRDEVVAAAQAAGFAVDDAQLVVRGLCADCRQRA
jgi:Fur family ferric uptake transcriptional regulator